MAQGTARATPDSLESWPPHIFTNHTRYQLDDVVQHAAHAHPWVLDGSAKSRAILAGAGFRVQFAGVDRISGDVALEQSIAAFKAQGSTGEAASASK